MAHDKDQDKHLVRPLQTAASFAGVKSSRMRGVWNDSQNPFGITEDVFRSSLECTVTPLEHHKLRRKEASEFIHLMTGISVACATDKEFRHQLRTGVTLCELLNAAAPNKIKICHIPEDGNAAIKGRYDNVQKFIAAAKELGVPSEYMFSMHDLESETIEDRPRVTDCILYLKRLNGDKPATLQVPHHDVSPSQFADSPRKAALLGVSGGLRDSAAFASPAGSALSGHEKLGRFLTHQNLKDIESITDSLKNRMTYNDSPASAVNSSVRAVASSPVDAIGPVLENVLSNLTKEYEQRILVKDQELSTANRTITQLRSELSMAQAKAHEIQDQLATAQRMFEEEAAKATSEQLERAHQQVEQLQTQLHAKETEIARLQQRVDEYSAGQDAETQRLEMELQDTRAQLQDMDNMKDRYKKMQQENRKLYNEVQDLKGAIRVFCRIRPAGKTGDGSATCVRDGEADEQEVSIHNPNGNSQRDFEFKYFKFDRVFGQDTTQEQIYEDTKPLIRSVLDGYNVTIFAYGQTGSGKTHTMSGTDVENPEGRGINYRALDDLFRIRDERNKEVDYTIKVQMLEIYNENLRDLLIANAEASTNRLEILNTQASGCNVPNATKYDVNSSDDVLSMMARGARNRHSAETKMNQRSSRSHQILTVIVDGINRNTGVRTHGCLHLIDLAGSERVSRSEATGDRLTEANHINGSLSALGTVMNALATNAKHIPFRNSKLTELLADSLSGQAKVMMFMHISPEASSYSESTSTLKFAERVASVTLGEARRNVDNGEAHRLLQQNAQLEMDFKQATAANQELQAQLLQYRREMAELTRQLEQARNQRAAGEMTPSSQAATPTESRPMSTPPPAYSLSRTKLENQFSFQQSPTAGGSTPSMPSIREAGKQDGTPHLTYSNTTPTPSNRPPLSSRTSGLHASTSAAVPTSSRTNGIHASASSRSLTSLKPSASMREPGRWSGTNSQSPQVAALLGSGASPTLQRSSSARPPTAPSPTSRVQSEPTLARAGSLFRNSSLPPSRPSTASTGGGSSSGNPSTPTAGGTGIPGSPATRSSNPFSSARPAGVYGGKASGLPKPAGASGIPVAVTPTSSSGSRVAASAGGVRGGMWSSSRR